MAREGHKILTLASAQDLSIRSVKVLSAAVRNKPLNVCRLKHPGKNISH